MNKKIIVIRHGEYDSLTMDLNITGQAQIKKLIPVIKEKIIGCKNILLLSSSLLRAESSTKIISEELNIPYELSEYLCFDGEHREDCDRALEFIRKKCFDNNNPDLVIIVTHIAYALSIPKRLAWWIKGVTFKDVVKKGEMVAVDRSLQTVSYHS